MANAMNLPPPFNYPACDAAQDAQILRNAMKGVGTDEKELIRIVCNRSRDQLAQISLAYESKYQKYLHDVIKSETTGHFRKVLLRRFQPQIMLKVKAMSSAMRGAGTKEERLVDCLAFASNAEIPHLKQIFLKLTGKELVATVLSETSGNFRDALKDLLEGNRDESQVNMQAITADVEKLYKAGEGKHGTDEKVFMKILCNHAPWYNLTLNAEYSKAHKHDLKKAVEKEFTGDLKTILISLLKSPYEYWADRFYYALKGVGTDDKTVVFLATFLDRHELNHVGNIIKDRHQKELKLMLKSDLSGDYQKAVMELCGY